MAWHELREREEDKCHLLKEKVRKVNYLMEEICELVEDDDMSERDDSMSRDGMSERRRSRYSRY